MITPRFEAEQNSEFVIVHIETPHIKIAEVEFTIEERQFKLYVKPYFLRLTFEKECVEDGTEKATYDATKGVITAFIPKKNKGEVFEDLGMITQLLTSKAKPDVKPLIEVVSSTNANGEEEAVPPSQRQGFDPSLIDWEVEQQLPPGEDSGFVLSHDAPAYGFNRAYSKVFEAVGDIVYEALDLHQPDTTKEGEREELQIRREVEDFDCDHYLSDRVFNEDEVKRLVSWKAEWETAPSGVEYQFTKEEFDLLKDLPKKEYLIQDPRSVYAGLIDLLFAYAYDRRTSEGEGTCESDWTFAKLSSTLSWLRNFASIEQALSACYRRSLCYPLYRHFALAEKVQADVMCILRRGRAYTVHCLLTMKKVLDMSDRKYLLSRIYLNDYCSFIQMLRDEYLLFLANEVESCRIVPSSVQLPVAELDAFAAEHREEMLADREGGGEAGERAMLQ
uniref:CS domain-containing protein n=1 Tax=Palpitomonas bilix TaxID=652834 RepID=A0A7S3G5P2_9EUKA